jgi:hypothetical protein
MILTILAIFHRCPACRGQVAFADISPFVDEMRPWVENMECPTFIKEHMGELLDKALAAK